MKIEIELDNLSKEEQEMVKRLATKKKKPYFVPKKGETYFLIDGCGFIDATHNDETDGDDFTISIGNCFHSKEEADEAIIRMQMQTKWKRLSLEAGEADNPWDREHGHLEVTYYFGCGIDYEQMIACQDGAVHFPTIESLKVAIKELGEENVKKYILGVDE